MSNYSAGGGGCFASTCTVERMRAAESFETVPVTLVRRGDVLKVDGGGVGVVLCTVELTLGPGALFSTLPSGPTLTSSHPVKVGGVWRRARDVCRSSTLLQNECVVHNFVLAAGAALLVDGVPALTFAHGLSDPGAAHSFYGTARVAEALSVLPGWASGAVRVGRVLRDEDGHARAFEADVETRVALPALLLA